MHKIVRSLLAPLALAAAVGACALDAANAQDKKDKKGGASATAVFELYKDTADQYRFRLKTGEGVLLATSGKGYKTKADCQKVIDAIKTTAGKAKVEEIAKK
jgi:uncharacterized protein YegP (UPF0339 family)